MPRTEPTVVDSPPVELPSHKPIPLKRTHSAASISSLPTPPRTRKRKRSRSAHSRATDSDSEIDEHDGGSESEEENMLRRKAEMRGVMMLGHKKRKVLQVDVIAAELSGQAAEDAFWASSDNTLLDKLSPDKAARTDKSKDKTAATTGERSGTPERSPSSSPPARLLKRNRTGLLSPPQSRRRKSPRARPFVIPQPILEEPSTPPRKTRPVRKIPKKAAPERDSPNNPFLDDGSSVSVASQDADAAVAGTSSDVAALRVPKNQHIEPPTIAYVFRGVRTEFANPLYNPKYPETGVAPLGEDDSSKLDPADPNFEPDEHCPPKLLFPVAQKKSRRRRHVTPDNEPDVKPPTKKAKGKLKDTEKSEWDTTDEEDNGEDGPEQEAELELPRTPEPRRSPRLARIAGAKVQSKEELYELAVPRMPEKHRSDPAKMAFGPRDRPHSRVEEVVSKPQARVEDVAPKAKARAQEGPSYKVKALEDPEENPFL